MFRPIRWLWALPGVGVIWAAALYFQTAAIEQDLTDRAKVMLAQVTHDWATPHLDGRTITLTGLAPHEGAKLEAVNLLYGVWGMRDVRDATRAMALIKPFVFSAQKQNNNVHVAGFFETVADKQDLIANIKRALPGHEIINALKLGGGQPAGWMRTTVFAARQLQHLKQGRVELRGHDLSISGMALSDEAKQALAKNLKTDLPQDYRLNKTDISDPVTP